MRQRCLATTACAVAAAATARTSFGFVCPTAPLQPRLSLQTTMRARLFSPNARNNPYSAVSKTSIFADNTGSWDPAWWPSVRRTKRRRTAAAPTMVYGGGGGFGRSRGGGGPRGPPGLDPGMVATAVFALLFIFAPGVIFGVFNTLFLAVTVGPILLSLGFNIYNRINTIEAPCPVCGAELEGIKSSRNECPSCGTILIASKGEFEALGSGFVRDEAGRQQEYTRVGDKGVIDVDAIDVELEDQ